MRKKTTIGRAAFIPESGEDKCTGVVERQRRVRRAVSIKSIHLKLRWMKMETKTKSEASAKTGVPAAKNLAI